MQLLICLLVSISAVTVKERRESLLAFLNYDLEDEADAMLYNETRSRPFGEEFAPTEGEGGTTIEEGYIHIQAISSRDGVLVMVNGQEVLNIFDQNNLNTKDFRNTTNGLHLVVLDSKSGRVASKKHFMTELFAESIAIHPALSSFSQDEIFIFAVKFDAALNLAKIIRDLFSGIGALIVPKVLYKSYFIWVFTRSGKSFLEAMINDELVAVGQLVTPPVKVGVILPKSNIASCWDEFDGPSNSMGGKRANFCQKYGGYGQLCDCEAPKDISFPEKELTGSVTGDVPVLIIASGRAQALYRPRDSRLDLEDQHQDGLSLEGLGLEHDFKVEFNPDEGQFIFIFPCTVGSKKSSNENICDKFSRIDRCVVTILSQPGGRRSHILVVIDGHHTEVEDLLQLLQIPHVINSITINKDVGKGGRICLQYKFAMTTAFKRYPKSKFLIVLEEDILAAPDFLSFFNQTARILETDPSLYCVSAWNDLSAMHTGGDVHTVLRMETQPAYGWMVTKDFFEEINLYWFIDKDYDWDIWFRGPWVRASRECLIPEVSRSFHMGESGVHIKGQMTYSHFVGHLTTAKENIVLKGVDRLREADYEEDLYSLLESDAVVFMNTSLHPCHSNYMRRNYTDKHVVIFVAMESNQDSLAWGRLASCLGLFNMDVRNHHRGLLRFRFFNTSVFAIGYPFSDYSYLKPPYVTPVSPYRSKWDDKYMGLMTLQTRKRFRVSKYEKYLRHPLLLEEPTATPFFVKKVIHIG